MARLGTLYLNHGNWDGKEIVPAEWVEASVEKHIETGGELDYGYQWWIYPSHGAYAALGRAGQTILVVPDLDLVIVTTAEIESHEIIFNLVEEYILPATKVEQ
jgi:CubicO group peptidase (beta-lactamase class C family)